MGYREQEQFPSGEVMNMMGAGVENIVTLGYLNFFLLIQNSLLLIVMIALMVYSVRNDL